VRLGPDFDVAQLDRFGHQQPQRGHEQRGDRHLVGAGAGKVHPEAVNGQVATVTEADGSVERRPVFSHLRPPLAVTAIILPLEADGSAETLSRVAAGLRARPAAGPARA
jgi:hypothetical protein